MAAHHVLYDPFDVIAVVLTEVVDPALHVAASVRGAGPFWSCSVFRIPGGLPHMSPKLFAAAAACCLPVPFLKVAFAHKAA